MISDRLGIPHAFYLADTDSHAIRLVDLRDGHVESVAGVGLPGVLGDGGPALAARLNSPTGVDVDVDASGVPRSLLIADGDSGRVRRVDLQTRVIETIAGSGTAFIRGDIDNDGLIGSNDLEELRCFFFPTRGGCAGRSDGLPSCPDALDVDDDGRIENDDLDLLELAVSTGLPPGSIPPPFPLCGLDPTPDALGCAEGTGDCSIEAGPARQVFLRSPSRVVSLDPNVVLVLDGDRLMRLDPIADDMRPIATFESVASDMTKDAQGTVLVSLPDEGRVVRVDAAGVVTTIVANASFEGRMVRPSAACESANGVLFVADATQHRVFRVGGGAVTLIAGNGDAGFVLGMGDRVAGTLTSLSNPSALLLDGVGNLYIVDQGNNRIRRLWVGEPSP